MMHVTSQQDLKDLHITKRLYLESLKDAMSDMAKEHLQEKIDRVNRLIATFHVNRKNRSSRNG